MPTLPKPDDSLIQTFAPHFSNSVWQQAQVLLIGAMLVPGRRTVTAVLRIMGLSQERQFQIYHRVLNRAAWSSWALSRTLLLLLVKTFVPKGPIVCGIDDTIERRRGAKIKAKGIYRDPVRSSHGHFVKASGLRWLTQIGRFQDAQIGRDDVAGFEHDHIAGHQFAGRDFAQRAAAADAHAGHRQLLKRGDCALGAVFLQEAQAAKEYHDGQDGHRLGPLQQHRGQHRRRQQDEHHGGGELLP